MVQLLYILLVHCMHLNAILLPKLLELALTVVR